MATPATSLSPCVSPLRTIARAGFIAGVLDGMDAIVFFCWIEGAPVVGLFQNIAGGVLGRKAFAGGAPTAVLGGVLHFLIATGAASVYYLGSLRFPLLRRKPALCGPLFGLGLYFFMYYGVLPLSAVPFRHPPTLARTVNELVAHTLFVGLPIAFVISRAMRKNRSE